MKSMDRRNLLKGLARLPLAGAAMVGAVAIPTEQVLAGTPLSADADLIVLIERWKEAERLYGEAIDRYEEACTSAAQTTQPLPPNPNFNMSRDELYAALAAMKAWADEGAVLEEKFHVAELRDATMIAGQASDRLYEEICEMPAHTLAGLQAKARFIEENAICGGYSSRANVINDLLALDLT